MTAQGALVSLCLGAMLWLLLMPRGWSRSLNQPELKAVRWYLLVRAAAPLATTYVGERADRFFSGGWDVNGYHNLGVAVARQIALGDVVDAHREVPGTGAIDLLTGYFYYVAGVDRLAWAYVSTLAATLGVLLFWLATRHLVGERTTAYAYVTLFAPTTLYWSANFGKEAPLLLGLGAGVMAVRLVLSGGASLRAAMLLVLAIVATGYVRPHVTLLLGVALVGGVVMGSLRAETAVRRVAGRRWLVGLAAVVVVLASAPLTSQLLNVGETESLLDAAYDRAEVSATGQGRSAFEAEPVRSPFQVPGAVTTVLFRPFLWESRTPLQVLAAVESTFFLVLTVRRLAEVVRRRARLRRSPLVVGALLFVLLFSSAIVTYGNFGLVVRQKMQVLPFLILVLFATVPATQARFRQSVSGRYGSRATTSEPPASVRTP